jgi:hypothetical protein
LEYSVPPGLFAIIKSNLSHIAYGIEHGFIPIVDMKNDNNQYIDIDKVKLGEDNSWEYYFEQPFGYSLDDIKKSKNIILSNRNPIVSQKYAVYVTMLDDKKRLYYFKRIFKKYIKFNQKTYNYLLNEVHSIIGNNKVLGILCRGTDYLRVKL